MVLDIGPLLRGETNRIPVDYSLKLEDIPEVEFSGDAHVVGEVTDNGGYIRLSFSADVAFNSTCARCLEGVSDKFSINFDRTLTREENMTEGLEENDDEYLVIVNNKLDLDEELREEFILEFPTRVLCSEDCPGLCPKCGKSLKYEKCNCSDHEIDPRWEALAALLKED